jgi:hypothetical protein
VTNYSQLLAHLTDRAREDAPALQLPGGLPEPLSPARIAEAEQRLGFPLHPLLAAIYRDVANGGFGPDYQLLSLIDGPTSEQAVDCYTEARTNYAGTEWAWPEGVLPILTWGCGMYACVDCRSDEGTLLLFEPNPGDPDLAWWIDSPSLTEWLGHYINNTGWWIRAEDGEDLDDMPPWPHAKDKAAM